MAAEAETPVPNPGALKAPVHSFSLAIYFQHSSKWVLEAEGAVGEILVYVKGSDFIADHLNLLCGQ